MSYFESIFGVGSIFPIWQPFIRGRGVAFKDFLGTADYSVGNPPATHVRGLGLGPKYSFFMSSPALLATGGRFHPKKNVFFRGQKGCFWLENDVYALKWAKMDENG